jgi:hypothetical protein
MMSIGGQPPLQPTTPEPIVLSFCFKRTSFLHDWKMSSRLDFSANCFQLTVVRQIPSGLVSLSLTS